MELSNSHLAAYFSGPYRQIEGWLQPPVFWVLDQIVAFQRENDLAAGAAEIGVHHGRFFLALESVTPPSERCAAFDVFGQQELNVDRSGSGDQAIFESNVKKYASTAERVEVHAVDSMTADARKLVAEREGSIALLSVDGGHTRTHVRNDMRLAELALSAGGVVFLDDYFNPDWPGVTDGLFEYLRSGGVLVPVVSAGGKIVLSRLSFAQRLQAHLVTAAREADMNVKAVELAGYRSLSVRPK